MLHSLRLSLLLIGFASSWEFSRDGNRVDPCSDDVSRPNIVMILMDGLGWGDLSATTGRISTPNMDKIYNNGVRLSRHYVHLAGSPSRTQFLTGRYAMNLGFGEFNSWDDSVAGGIPSGQPTLANWLRDLGGYTTYAVGKWHLGYANRLLLPAAKGFDHFFGFYQGAIAYDTKKYNYNGRMVHDFWEDGEPAQDAVDSELDSMRLYADKIDEYLATEADKNVFSPEESDGANHFFLLAALQSMHIPLPEVEEQFADQCGDDNYCSLLLLTDEIVGRLISSLRQNHLWDSTLIVFSSAEGGEIARGASNYPLRGSQGEFHDGNNRVLTAVYGGYIEKELNLVAPHSGAQRDSLVSNLDWTPTLLSMAGFLDCIDESDRTWDGVDQSAVIVSDDAEAARTELVLNIEDKFLKSAAVVFESDDGALIKFVSTDISEKGEEWVNYKRFHSTDSWSEVTSEGVLSVKVWEEHSEEAEMKWSQMTSEGALLFDLSADESEHYNLLNEGCPDFDDARNQKLLDAAESILNGFLDEDELWSPALPALHEKLSAGEPGQSSDGLFVRPFLKNDEYKAFIRQMFIDEKQFHPAAQKALYTEEWVSPWTYVKSVEEERAERADETDEADEEAGAVEEVVEDEEDEAEAEEEDLEEEQDTEEEVAEDDEEETEHKETGYGNDEETEETEEAEAVEEDEEQETEEVVEDDDEEDRTGYGEESTEHVRGEDRDGDGESNKLEAVDAEDASDVEEDEVSENEGLEEDGLPVIEGLSAELPASKTLKWWIILIIVAAIVVVIASLVITGIKCYRVKNKQNGNYSLIGNEDATPQQYQTFN